MEINDIFSTGVTAGMGAVLLGLLTAVSKWHMDHTKEDRARFESMLNSLKADIDRQRDEARALTMRIDVLETEMCAERDLRSRIVDYARRLLVAWKQHFPDDPPPDPPPSIAQHFDT